MAYETSVHFQSELDLPSTNDTNDDFDDLIQFGPHLTNQSDNGYILGDTLDDTIAWKPWRSRYTKVMS